MMRVQRLTYMSSCCDNKEIKIRLIKYAFTRPRGEGDQGGPKSQHGIFGKLANTALALTAEAIVIIHIGNDIKVM